MTDSAPGSLGAIFGALGSGLPHLLLQFVLALVLLGLGVAAYMATTPFQERRLLQSGNAAAGAVLGGAIVALAIPLAVLLATTPAVLDLLVWGVVAILIQLVTFFAVSLLLGHLRAMVEAANVAAAIPLVAAQLAVALLNAAAMVPV